MITTWARPTNLRKSKVKFIEEPGTKCRTCGLRLGFNTETRVVTCRNIEAHRKTPQELLEGVIGWIKTLANRYWRDQRYLSVDDVVNEIALKILKSANGYDPTKAKATTWATRVAMSTIYDMNRKNNQRFYDHLEEMEFEENVPEPDRDTNRPAVDKLEALMSTLTFREEQVIAERYGLTGKVDKRSSIEDLETHDLAFAKMLRNRGLIGKM